MSGSTTVSRTLTTVAVAFLTFDGAALAAVGFMTGRVVLVFVGAVFFLSAGLVLLYWRWQRRRLEEIAAERSGLSAEARGIQRLMKEGVSGEGKRER